MICKRCGRKLRGVRSIERGYGPVCFRKEKRSEMIGGRAAHPKEEEQCPGQMEIEDFPELLPDAPQEDSDPVGEAVQR